MSAQLEVAVRAPWERPGLDVRVDPSDAQILPNFFPQKIPKLRAGSSRLLQIILLKTKSVV